MESMRFSPLLLAALLGSGCATARLAQDKTPFPPDPGVTRTVIVEPLFEVADTTTATKTEYANVMSSGGYGYGGYGYGSMGGPSTVAITRQVQEKPLFARQPVLNEVHRKLLAELQRRRPSWRVTSTSGAPVLAGDVTVVRTVIQGNQTWASDRTFKTLALGFGFVIWPLEFIQIDPVHETERVYGVVERFNTNADTVRARLVKYPTQPDYAVNLSGISSARHEFGLDVSYVEGVLANESPRPNVLMDGFVDRYASAVIASVEEVGAAPALPPLPPR
jgi:hypothetical protein